MRHWKCWRRTGNPIAQHIYLSDEARFLTHVDLSGLRTGGCALWTGHLDDDGYGRFRVGGRRGQYIRASRWAYEHWVGPIENLVCHRCDVPTCVKPNHLWDGTNADNTRDMIEKGRAAWQLASHVG